MTNGYAVDGLKSKFDYPLAVPPLFGSLDGLKSWRTPISQRSRSNIESQ
jgi:hypothetical protein